MKSFLIFLKIKDRTPRIGVTNTGFRDKEERSIYYVSLKKKVYFVSIIF